MRRRPAETAALDLIPVLSLVVHIIPMLLLAVRFAALAQLPMDAPPIEATPAPSRAQLEHQLERRVAVRISDAGLSVTHGTTVSLPCAGACALDTYDWRGLAAELDRARDRLPGERVIVVAPAATTPYEVVVRAMDVAALAEFSEPLLVTGASR